MNSISGIMKRYSGPRGQITPCRRCHGWFACGLLNALNRVERRVVRRELAFCDMLFRLTWRTDTVQGKARQQSTTICESKELVKRATVILPKTFTL
jgi:hypothetical protein